MFRSPLTDGFELLTTFGGRARIGILVSDLYAGPTSRFNLGNTLVVDLLSGTLKSVTDLALFGGANMLAVESAPGRYRLTRLLRAQRDTESTMGNPAPAGAKVVALDENLASLPISASRGTGVSVRRAVRSVTRPMWRRPLRWRA